MMYADIVTQEAFKLMEESEEHNLQGDQSVKELQQEARKLKRLCVEYSDAREYGKTEKDFTAHKAMRLLEDGSNAVKAVVRCANGVKARIAVAKAMAKK